GVNLPPVMNVISNQTVPEGTFLNVWVEATDPDGDALTYTATPLPPGAAFGAQTLTWRPSLGQSGEYAVVFTATDPYGASDSETAVISVVPDPSALRASLSWSPDSIVTDLSSPGSINNLYVRLDNVASFKGGEIDLVWQPPGDTTECIAHVGTLFRTSVTCDY